MCPTSQPIVVRQWRINNFFSFVRQGRITVGGGRRTRIRFPLKIYYVVFATGKSLHDYYNFIFILHVFFCNIRLIQLHAV